MTRCLVGGTYEVLTAAGTPSGRRFDTAARAEAFADLIGGTVRRSSTSNEDTGPTPAPARLLTPSPPVAQVRVSGRVERDLAGAARAALRRLIARHDVTATLRAVKPDGVWSLTSLRPTETGGWALRFGWSPQHPTAHTRHLITETITVEAAA